MPSLYSTLLASEPGYGERIGRVHGGLHHVGIPHTEAVDLVTGERVLMPIGSRWDPDTRRDVRVCADGWSWHPVALTEAEQRAGLPRGSLPPSNDSERTDLWADQRMRNPAFIALLTILADHPQIVFYDVDWRYWVHEQQPHEHPYREDSPPLTTPKQTGCIGSGRHLPYQIGGSGDMERYASHLGTLLSAASSPTVVKADEVFDTLSGAVLADLAHDYERIVEWQRRPEPVSRLRPGPAEMPAVRSLADIQTLVGWTADLLAELDDVHAATRQRLDAETAAYRPQGVALALF